jgi:hypothetical protein
MKFKNAALSFISVVLVFALAGSANVVFADNMLVNPGFETGDLTGWVVAGQSANSDVTVELGNGPTVPGTYNAFMNNLAEAMGLTLKQTTENGTAIGGIVEYSFDLKLDQADVGGVLFVEIFAEEEGVGIVGGSGLMGPYWPWEWTSYSGAFEAPEGTTFLTIQIMANTGAAIGTNCVAHVDNVVLDQGTVATEQSNWNEIKALYR